MDSVRRRVLFVEDDPALQSAYRRYFRERYEVAMAGTVISALEQFASFRPEVVVVDLRLPDGDGLDLVHRLRERRPELPVVITSAYASPAQIVQMMGIAHSGYLVKPFDLTSLGACIDAAR